MALLHEKIKSNLARVNERIEASAERSGRTSDAIQLVAVTKYVDAEWTRAVFECGCQVLGESRPQDLWKKADVLKDLPIRWHMIGHMQRNKVRRTIPYLTFLESIDSERLLAAVEESAEEPISVLLEVNISGDESKHGFEPQEIADILGRSAEWKQVRVRGLMAMAGLTANRDSTRRQFAELRELRDRLEDESSGHWSLRELSMGMSRDFDIAIEEGATMVRVGSALYEGLR